jgi:hypothetical protein
MTTNRREILGYVFGYGSLVDPADWLFQRHPGEFEDPTYVLIDGFRRHWDLAADNTDADHDHKYHADAATGERVDIYVATLGLELDEETACNGVAIPVDAERLAWLDRREGLLYDRIVIDPGRISEPLEGTLWTYFPKPTALAAFEAGMQRENVYLPRFYIEGVTAAFTRRGEDALSAYRASTREPRCPLRDLNLVRAPGDAGI